jgi:hypothetical protein
MINLGKPMFETLGFEENESWMESSTQEDLSMFDAPDRLTLEVLLARMEDCFVEESPLSTILKR